MITSLRLLDAVIGRYLMVIGRYLMVIGRYLMVIGRYLMVIGRYLIEMGCRFSKIRGYRRYIRRCEVFIRETWYAGTLRDI